jgi:hypothetical protein
MVQSALSAWEAGENTVLDDGSLRGFVIPRTMPFEIEDAKFWQDFVVLDSGESTGLLNPRVTMLRVVDNTLDHKFVRSAGANLADALRQLPPEREGVIVLGDLPKRIAESAIARRIADKAYDHILWFIVSETDMAPFHFIHRTEKRSRLEQLLEARAKPLPYSTANDSRNGTN